MRPPKPKVKYKMLPIRSNGIPLPEVTLKRIAKQQRLEVCEAMLPSMEPEWMKQKMSKQKDVPRAPNYQAQCRARVHNDELGKLIKQHAQLLVDNGWDNFIRLLRQQGDLRPDPDRAGHHPACRLLHNISKRGVPAMMTTEPWS